MKWRPYSAPDDPDSYYDANGVWATPRGTYESAATGQLAAITATSPGTAIYAFRANTITSSVEYVVTGTKIWQIAGAAATDRTGGVTIGNQPMMTQYGNVTICAMGNSTATVNATGGNFAALAGAPQAEIVLVCANAVLYFNTNTSADGWAASDVGDYTNYTTGEAASGRLIQTPGPITAAVAFGNDVIVFKSRSIYRGRYVGGVVKWAWELIWSGVGCSGQTTAFTKYQACVGAGSILFAGYSMATDATFLGGAILGAAYYAFDGVSPPRRVNLDTPVAEGMLVYDPREDRFTLLSYTNGGINVQQIFYYQASSDGWSRATGPASTSQQAVLVTGALEDGTFYSRPTMYLSSGNFLNQYIAAARSGGYVQTQKMGRRDRKTQFSRLLAILRRRTDLGTDSVSLGIETFREAEDTSTVTTDTVAESAQRHRFDFNYTENFARFKLTFTAIDFEIEGVAVQMKEAGE